MGESASSVLKFRMTGLSGIGSAFDLFGSHLR
jgi:hypothetical protein